MNTSAVNDGIKLRGRINKAVEIARGVKGVI